MKNTITSLTVISLLQISPIGQLVHAEPLEVQNADNELRIHAYVDGQDRGTLEMWDSTANPLRSQIQLGFDNRFGKSYLQLSDPEGEVKLRAHVDAADQGTIFLYGTREGYRVRLGSHNRTDNAYLYLHDVDGTTTVRAYADQEKKGQVHVFGDGAVKVYGLTSQLFLSDDDFQPQLRGEFFSDPSRRGGTIRLYDSKGNRTITLNGATGTITKAGMNGFLIPHPSTASKEIFYASMEGPEAGLYTRGTARLSDGRATVNLPEHFSIIANPESMTVHLTPTSSNTYGLAVVEKNQQAFTVQELSGGKGNSGFDYVVFAARGDIPPIEVVRGRE